METQVQQWYSGRSVFVTGGTGFMGKVLLEKLLRSLPSLEKLYILIRPKRGDNPKDRVKKIYDLPVFDRLKQECPTAFNKLIAIEGDVSSPGLGLSDRDRRILEDEVSVVIHAAATLKLEASLKEAILMNTTGTKRVLEIARNMKKLEAFVHLSTAFCHCDVEVLEEKIYPPTQDPYEMMKLAEDDTDNSLAELEEILIKPFPNTYTFTKRLAETVCWDLCTKYRIPLMIGRPSIVIPSLREPTPGWVDSLNGPVGVLIASGKGVLRSMLVEENNHAEVIPVDIAINGLISGAWYIATKRIEEPYVCNITQADVLSITWGEVLTRGKKLIYENPFEWMLWYPDGNIRTNRTIHNIIVFLFQIIPAYFIDLLFYILRMPRFMVRVQEKITFGMKLLEYFTLREWKFDNKKGLAIGKAMTPEDLEIFYMANAEFDIDDFLRMTILGARTYCMKENPKSISFWRKYLKFLYVLDKSCKLLFVYGIFYMVLFLFNAHHIITWQFWFERKELPGHLQINN